MYRLHIIPADGPPFDHNYNGGRLVLGRSAESDVPIRDRYMSRAHLAFSDREGFLIVEDLGSRNGTMVDGKVIPAPTRVDVGSEITASGTVIRIESTALSAHATTVLHSASELLNTGSNSLQGEDVESLKLHTERLELLNKVHHLMASTMTIEELLQQILDRVFDLMGPEESAVYLSDEKHGIRPAAVRTKDNADLHFSRSMFREVVQNKMAALVVDALDDGRFAGSQSIVAGGFRSFIAAPLLAGEEAVGMMVLSSRTGSMYSKNDLELLVSLASVVGMRLHNLELAQEAQQRRMLENELKRAREIQMALLPSNLPQIASYEIHAYNEPSMGVSGDYYTVVERTQGDVAFMVVDVSGKGMAASILTASLEALTAALLQMQDDPTEIFARLSELLLERTHTGKYATACLLMLQPERHRITRVSAGHGPAIQIHGDGGITKHGGGSHPLGLLNGSTYTSSQFDLEPGDIVAIFTDGITEAENRGDEDFGDDRLAESLANHRQKELPDLAETIIQELTTFAEGVPFADDRTLVLLRRKA